MEDSSTETSPASLDANFVQTRLSTYLTEEVVQAIREGLSAPDGEQWVSVDNSVSCLSRDLTRTDSTAAGICSVIRVPYSSRIEDPTGMTWARFVIQHVNRLGITPHPTDSCKFQDKHGQSYDYADSNGGQEMAKSSGRSRNPDRVGDGGKAGTGQSSESKAEAVPIDDEWEEVQSEGDENWSNVLSPWKG